MLNLYICEDNDKQRKKFTDIIENTIIREELDVNISLSTKNPFKVLETVKNMNGIGIYFLDVDLNCKINGIELAEKIRELDPEGFIIFVTTHAEMSLLTFEYKVEAMDYIIKNNIEKVKERINDCLVKACERYRLKNKDFKLFSIKTEDKVIHLKYSDILFFETSDTIHKIRIHEMNRQLEFYGKLKEIENQLDDRFYRCHRAFIVNKENIKEIDKKNRLIYMINGEECLVSVRGLKGI